MNGGSNGPAQKHTGLARTLSIGSRRRCRLLSMATERVSGRRAEPLHGNVPRLIVVVVAWWFVLLLNAGRLVSSRSTAFKGPACASSLETVSSMGESANFRWAHRPIPSVRRHKRGDNQIDRARVLEVRIHLPPAKSQVRTCLWREFVSVRREAAVSRGCGGWASGAVDRDAQGPATSRGGAVVSLSGDIPVPQCRRGGSRQWGLGRSGFSNIDEG